MSTEQFRGLGVAMVTPFNQDKEIDYDATEKLIEHLVTGGVDFLVVMGTTGESATLTDKEKRSLIKFVIKKNDGRLPIMLGIGGNDTNHIIEQIDDFDFDGIDAILSVTPYYNKPTQKGLELHFKAIAAQSELPIVLYNVPGRTGVNMTAETTLKLAHEVPNIIGIKEASGNLNQMSYILRDRPDNFLVLSGDDGLTLPQMSMGADGVISVVGNALPKRFSEMVKLAQQHNFVEASKIHLELIEIIDSLFVEGNPGGVKAALSILGIVDNNLRLPLAPISESAFYKLSLLLQNQQ
ncbi:MAG TPA: 4-hydroxy-tetrahydrodipicolinate synthase [Tenuifilaceae bacterium]|nr:4-hydroxy-tetrahydrodipicolinate synthase [Tenuifilaceae bacterium]HPI45283.1 4-hydroxy-tetrahydrodipicolinate synthase [Tenuifilaceae bacterium]HPN20871.1 4-hydroxy-tetrahydrodipicolinate synthase [Tenuifilaceae bacterium]